MKKNEWKLVPVASVSPFPTKIDVALQPLHSALRNFVSTFQSYSRVDFLKKMKKNEWKLVPVASVTPFPSTVIGCSRNLGHPHVEFQFRFRLPGDATHQENVLLVFGIFVFGIADSPRNFDSLPNRSFYFNCSLSFSITFNNFFNHSLLFHDHLTLFNRF